MQEIVNPVASRKWGWLLLFTSSATLLCCALPLLLVSLGLGAVSASLFSTLPWLTWLGLHKAWTFGITGLILALAGWAIYRSGRSCPTDPTKAEICAKATRWNKRMWLLALALWIIGFFTAYLFVPIARILAL